MTSLQESTAQDFTEQAAEQTVSESLKRTVLVPHQVLSTASSKKRKRRRNKIGEFRQKASEGDVNAQLFLADHYKEKENEEKATSFYKLAADQGNRLGILGLAYQTDDDVDSYKLILKAALLGLPEAQFQISLRFLQGAEDINIPKNLEEGFLWMEKAANNGYIMAEYYMGSMYRKGVWVEQSDLNAFQWFQRSAENGFAPAQFSLGKYYESDLVGKKDKNAAYDWKLKAAHQGYIEVAGELTCQYDFDKNQISSAVDIFDGPN
jgi:TPR repeat protein